MYIRNKNVIYKYNKMVDTTIIDELKASIRAEQYRKASKKCYCKKIREKPEFYAAEKERIKLYKNERYKNDPEYAEKMKQRSREYYQRKLAKKAQTFVDSQ
jgi:hypothetical protein